MHLPKIAAALLLPLLAAAQGTASLETTTMTSTVTMTQTLTISRVIATQASNSTGFHATGTGAVKPPSPTDTGGPITPAPKAAGNALSAVNVAMAGVAGMAIVALL